MLWPILYAVVGLSAPSLRSAGGCCALSWRASVPRVAAFRGGFPILANNDDMDIAPLDVPSQLEPLNIPERFVVVTKNPFTSRVISTVACGLGLFTIAFAHLERWSLLDSFYFTASTATCIGFGDLRPVRPLSHVLTSLLSLFGAGALGGLVGAVLSEYYREQRVLEDETDAMDAGDAEGALEAARPAAVLRRLVSPRRWWVQSVLLLGAGIGGFKLVEPAVSWADASYCILGTLTTAGIGDVVPSGERAKLFISLYSLVGTLAFARVIGKLALRPLDRARRLAQKRILDRYG
jgi:hypothetical protein